MRIFKPLSGIFDWDWFQSLMILKSFILILQNRNKQIVLATRVIRFHIDQCHPRDDWFSFAQQQESRPSLMRESKVRDSRTSKCALDTCSKITPSPKSSFLVHDQKKSELWEEITCWLLITPQIEPPWLGWSRETQAAHWRLVSQSCDSAILKKLREQCARAQAKLF